MLGKLPRDLRFAWDPVNARADLVLTSTGDLAVTTDPLETWLILSLFTDRRADQGDVLPPGDDDPRGWWGDNLQTQPGDRIGSKLWLRRQATPLMPRIVEGDALEATRWLIEDGYVEAIGASAVYNNFNREEIDLTLSIATLAGETVPFGFPRAVTGLG